MTAPHSRLQVVITAGPSDPAKAKFALELALASAVSGVETAVFLSLEATEWACEATAYESPEVSEMLSQLTTHGASVMCCSACAFHRCGAADTTHGCAVAHAVRTRPGITLGGVATLVERIASGIPTVTF